MSIKLCVVLLLLLGSCSSVRLPETTRPSHYDLRLNIDVVSGTFSGSVTIQVNPTRANSSLIALNYHDIQVQNVSIYPSSDHTKNLLSSTRTIPTTQIVEFSTSEVLNQHTEYVVRADFSSVIRSDLKGLYKSSYFVNGTRRNIATTFFAPHYARMVFPCYDEPHYKATFDVHITHGNQFHALGNAKIKSRVSNQVGKTATTSFERTPRMSTYLLAFIVSDFVASVSSADNSIAVWSQSAKASATGLSLRYAPQVRNVLEDFLGLPYQMNKLDLVAVDDFLMGAMENWGVITFASGRLLSDSWSTTEEEERVLKIVSHELVHQWFGNLVTCHWWTDIWLNEGFATYLEDVIADKVANQWLVLDQFVITEKIPAMRKDSDRANRKAMNQPVNSLNEIAAIYDFVAYPKAASVIRMFHHVVGEDIFRQTLVAYLKAHQFGNVERKDFFAVLETTARQLNWSNPQGVILSEAFEHWASNFGFPLVTVERNGSSGNLQIAQTRFINSHFNSHTEDVKFFVPLKFYDVHQGRIDSLMGVKWLSPNSNALQIGVEKNSLYILNPDSFGYFRVNYDEGTWKELSAILHATNQLSANNRVQLIDDVMTLARFGKVPYGIALDLIEYITKETNYTPLSMALSHLNDLGRNIRGLTNVNFSEMVKKILNSIYKAYKTNASNPEKRIVTEIRNFACRHGYEKCIEDGQDLFLTFLNQGTAIQPDLRKSSLCASVQLRVQNGVSETQYNNILALWRKLASLESDRLENERLIQDILDSFACVKNATLLSDILTLSLSNDSVPFMTPGDRVKIFSSVVSGSIAGTELGLKLLQNQWSFASERYGGATPLLTALAPNIVTRQHVTMFSNLVFNHLRKGELRRLQPLDYETTMAAVRQVEENSQFLTNNENQLEAWFKENYPGSGATNQYISIILLIVTLVLSLPPVFAN